MNILSRRKFIAALSATSVAFAFRSNSVRAQNQTVVKFASVGGITDAGIYLGEDFGLFEKAGIKIERQRMTNAPTLITAVATGQIDVAGISVTPGLFSSVDQGLNLRIVGDKQSLRPGVSAARLVMRSDLIKSSEAENVRSMKGMNVAVTARASNVYMLLRDVLAKHGMALSDVRIVELSYPNMFPAFTSKAIDAAISIEPFLSQSLQAGITKQVSDLTEVVPAEGATIVPLVYSEAFVAKTKIANDFMKVYIQGVRAYNDAFLKDKDKEKVVEILARFTNVDPKIIRGSFPAGLDPNQQVNLAFLDRFQKFFIEQNFLRSSTDVRKVVDMSFVEAAIKELGPYK